MADRSLAVPAFARWQRCTIERPSAMPLANWPLPSFRQVVDLSFLRDTASFKYTFANDKVDFEFKDVGNVVINGDKEKLNLLQSEASILAGTEDIYISCLKNQLDYSKKLINFLKKEYDID